MSQRPTTVGQTVSCLAFPFSEPEADAMRGEVLKITNRENGSGGTKSTVTVRWDNGYTGSGPDRSLAVVNPANQRNTTEATT